MLPVARRGAFRYSSLSIYRTRLTSPPTSATPSWTRPMLIAYFYHNMLGTDISRLLVGRRCPLMVKFVHMCHRDHIFRNKKLLKGRGLVITENQTRKRKEILDKMHQKGMICWTFYRNIFGLDDHVHKKDSDRWLPLTGVAGRLDILFYFVLFWDGLISYIYLQLWTKLLKCIYICTMYMLNFS